MNLDLLVCTAIVCGSVIYAGRRIEWRLAQLCAEISNFQPDELHDDVENIRRYAANIMMRK